MYVVGKPFFQKGDNIREILKNVNNYQPGDRFYFLKETKNKIENHIAGNLVETHCFYQPRIVYKEKDKEVGRRILGNLLGIKVACRSPKCQFH